METSALVCFVVLAVCTVEGSEPSAEYRLRSELTSRYDGIRRQMVPGQDQGQSPLKLSFGMTAIKILDFSEDTDVITLYGWNKMGWKDVNLQWDPKDYGGLTMLRMPSSLMWRPDIVLYSSLTLGSNQDESVMVIVQSSGDVLFIPPAISKIHCNPISEDDDDDDDDSDEDQHHHDLDHPEWKCRFKFGSWVYDGETIELQLFEDEPKIDLSDFKKDKKYELVSTSAKVHGKVYDCCPEKYYDVTMTMHIRRK